MSFMKKKIRPASVKSAINPTKYSDQISRERLLSQDLLVARYLEEFVVNKNKTKKNEKLKSSKSENYKSPYASSIILSGDPDYGYKKALSKHNLMMPHPPKSKRPISAPVYRLGTGSWTNFDDLNASGSYSVSLVSSNTSVSSKKPVYKRKTKVLCVKAFVNGSRERYVRVAAADLSQLLVECTTKLGLPSAARKLYLCNGTLVVNPRQLEKDCEVYVSTGEAFKDPYLNLQEREKVRQSSFWTVNGILIPTTRSKTKRLSSTLSSRMLELSELQKRRILVFKNGESSGGVEIIANCFDEFFDDCTLKLHLNAGARCLYDWSGKIVESFSQVPSLHKVLQPSTGSVLGPLWVTKGEAFSPKGAHDFLSTMIMNTKDRIRDAKQYIEQLEAQYEEGDEYLLLDVEMQVELQREHEDLSKLEEALPKLKEYLTNIKKSYQEEEAMSSSAYKFKHISEINNNSRLLSSQGLKIRLYANGSKCTSVDPLKMFINIKDLKKGTHGKTQALQKFFDVINSNDNIMNLFGIHGRKIFVKRAFLLNGCKITDVDMINQDEQIWLSLGKGFILVEYPVVTLNIEKVKVLDLWGLRQFVQRDLWMGGDQNQTKPKLWKSVSTMPPHCDSQEMKLEMTDEQKHSYLKQSSETRIRNEITFIQSKLDHSLILYPELTLFTKGQDQESDIWGQSIQLWCIRKDGMISNKHFKNLVLGIFDREIKMSFYDSGESETYEGAVVGLCVKPTFEQINNPFNASKNNLWTFTSDGYIQSTANPGYVLTAVSDFILEQKRQPVKEMQSEATMPPQWDITNSPGNDIVVMSNSQLYSSDSSNSSSNEEKKERKKKKKIKNATVSEKQPEIVITQPTVNPLELVENVYGGENVNLVVLPRFPDKHPLVAKQKWAIKTQFMQTHLCEKWQRQHFCWPVDDLENYLEGSLEGYLTYGAPKLKFKTPKENEDSFNVAKTDNPTKLQVLRNGEIDISRAVTVVGPDVKKLKNGISVPSATHNSGDGMTRLSSVDVEVYQFLEKCTEALGLPFAARRLFSADGREVLSLLDFEKHDLVYVSCGENWNDPSVSQAEQQKRILLANLASDVAKIKRFVKLRRQSGFIIKIEDDASYPGVRLCLMEEPLEEYDDAKTTEEQINDIFSSAQPESQQPEEQLTAHERTHVKFSSSKTYSQILSVDENFNHSVSVESMKSLSHREALFCESAVKYSPYQWAYADDFIYLNSNPNLVIGVQENEVLIIIFIES